MLHKLAAPWVEGWLDLLFPPRCSLCRTDLRSGGWPATAADAGGSSRLCAPCRRTLTADVPRCLLCGARAAAGGTCPRCLRACHGCAGLVVLGGYADELREAVLRCKRPGGEILARALAALLVARHRGTLASWHVDLVVPVPMHWRRRTVRGTSAADELAAGVAGGLGLPWRSVVRRAVATRMQNEVPVPARRGNVAAAFRVRGRVSGKRLLLVDDVCTTGSTLAACSAVLSAAGAHSVHAAVVAKADRTSNEGDD